MQYKNLEIIGTSHISIESMKEVEEKITALNPAVVAVELDKQRLYMLMNENVKKKVSLYSIRIVGLKGFLFALVASWVSNWLGKKVGIKPGADMKKAVQFANSLKIPVALIDQDINVTLKKMSKRLTWKEKWHFVVDFWNGIFFKKKQMRQYSLENFDLSKVPSASLIEKMISKVEKMYPSIYKTLITERNYIMGKKLIKLMKENPDRVVIAVVGAGHREGMIKYIKDKWDKIEIVGKS